MATRPIFVPNFGEGSLVRRVNAEFEWHPGFSEKQKRKNIRGLHESAAEKGIRPVLEISTKSEEQLGRNLSAFNLKVIVGNEHEMTVESAYQASKVFEDGGPYTELYDKPSRESKRDPRLSDSGDLVGFNLKGDIWDLEPKTAFYDWIYVNALHQHQDIESKIEKYAGFTDIEFNPKKSISCQARSAALFISLVKRGLLREVLRDKEAFKEAIAISSHDPVDETEFVDEVEPGKLSKRNDDLWIQGNLFEENKEGDT
jgi:hypothetical protein